MKVPLVAPLKVLQHNIATHTYTQRTHTQTHTVFLCRSALTGAGDQEECWSQYKAMQDLCMTRKKKPSTIPRNFSASAFPAHHASTRTLVDHSNDHQCPILTGLMHHHNLRVSTL